jgi:hypothetical protein
MQIYLIFSLSHFLNKQQPIKIILTYFHVTYSKENPQKKTCKYGVTQVVDVWTHSPMFDSLTGAYGKTFIGRYQSLKSISIILRRLITAVARRRYL